jgi:hypothetical protein
LKSFGGLNFSAENQLNTLLESSRWSIAIIIYCEKIEKNRFI